MNCCIKYHIIPKPPYQTIPYHIIPHHTKTYHVLNHATPYHIILNHTIPNYGIPYYTIPQRTKPLRTIPYFTTLLGKSLGIIFLSPQNFSCRAPQDTRTLFWVNASFYHRCQHFDHHLLSWYLLRVLMKARSEDCHNLRLKSRHFSLKESSVILLVSHRAQSLQPYCDNWFENIKDLVDKYFKYDFCVVFICYVVSGGD